MGFREATAPDRGAIADDTDKLYASAAWHTLTVAETAERLTSDSVRGLTEQEASRRLRQFGWNRFEEGHARSAFTILRAQFHNFIVVLLLAAAAIAFALGENVEAVAILIVIVLNAAIGFLTEWRAENALSALRKQSVRSAHVIRGGDECQVPAAELVPGDLVVLAAGSRVPADGRIVEAARLQIEEAALTGESQAASKTCEPVGESDAALGDQFCMAFMGTAVTDGRGRLLVTATGMRTEVGKIGAMIERAGTRETPLEQELDRLGKALLGIVLALCAVIVGAGWLRGHNLLHMLKVGISLAIAAVPEGLPAVATMTLAIGMQRMARMRVLIRRLPAVETLGSVTVICTDKTGTLTRNEMTVQSIVLNGRRIKVTGHGYLPAGEFRTADGAFIDAKADHELTLALRTGALCNDARVDIASADGAILGDPTEAALLIAAAKAGITGENLDTDYPRVDEIPFDSHTKRMITVHRSSMGAMVAFLKGSPGTLLDLSESCLRDGAIVPLSAEHRQRWLAWNRTLAGEALRVLGLAYRELPREYEPRDLDSGYVFIGLVGMIDPLRDEVRDAIALCRQAGIRTIMITGDQPPTAAEIGRQLGLDHDSAGRLLAVVHARELEGLDAETLDRLVSTSGVFARVSPKHKLELVNALQRRGEIVAMTGDGVNDAPALKQADIGVAMGLKGTEVAKETADMIITDDNFATIVAAVSEGRIIFANILKFIHYLFSCNFAEILTVSGAIMMDWPLPLTALQILWLNLLTDVFPALALTLEPSAPDMMSRPPRDPREGLVTRAFLGLVAWQGAMLAAVTLLAFGLGLHWHGRGSEGVDRASTMAFSTLALAQVVHAFNTRSRHRSAFTSRLFVNRWLWAAVAVCMLVQGAALSVPLLHTVLHTVPPLASEWMVIVACSFAPLLVVEVSKLVRRLAARTRQQPLGAEQISGDH